LFNCSCNFFSYSWCLPCCISSLVKLASGSPVSTTSTSCQTTDNNNFLCTFKTTYPSHVGTYNLVLDTFVS
jgi:hypothetical protein